METITKIIDLNAHIANITCEISTDNDMTRALISFDNLGFGIITAIKFNAKGLNSFGDIVPVGGKEKFYLIIQDINIEKNTHAKDLKAKLPNNDIRKLELEECQICYTDGSLLSYTGADNRKFEIEQFGAAEHERETLDAIQDIISPKAKNIPQEIDSGWLCCCERYNSNDLTICSNCDAKKADVFKVTDPAFIDDIIEQHKKNKEDRLQKALQEIKEKETVHNIRTRIGIISGIIIGILLVVLVVLISRAVFLSSRTTYSSEAEMKSALQGTYTYYNSSGKATRQIVIKGDTAIYKWNSDKIDDLEATIKTWDYRNGVIHTFEDLIVTDQGALKQRDDIYKKGGYMVKSSTSSYNYESGYSVLEITVDSLTSNSVYTICNGSVKNTGTKTYKFIEVKGAFKDSSGNVIDTDWTYAAGSEGLAPGELTTFRLSVDKNWKIVSCSVSLLNFK